MLGLVAKEELGATGVDFRTYTSIATLYTQFATYLLINSSPNETQFWWPVFNLAFTLNKRDELPSWVPDFHRQEKGGKDVCTTTTVAGFGRTSRQYCASGRPTTVKQGSRAGEIVLRGKILDKIIVVHPAGTRNVEKSNRPGSEAEWLASIAEWQEIVAQAILRNDDHEGNRLHDHANEKWRVAVDTYWKTCLPTTSYTSQTNPLTCIHVISSVGLCRRYASGVSGL